MNELSFTIPIRLDSKRDISYIYNAIRVGLFSLIKTLRGDKSCRLAKSNSDSQDELPLFYWS